MCLPHLSRTITFNDKGGWRGVFMDTSFTFTLTLKRDLSGVRLGGFLRVIRELQIVDDGFKSAVNLLLKANVFGCLVVRRFAICSTMVLESLAVQTTEGLVATLSV